MNKIYKLIDYRNLHKIFKKIIIIKPIGVTMDGKNDIVNKKRLLKNNNNEIEIKERKK